MAINFLSEKLSRISCSHVCSDAYPVENLMSSHRNVRYRGFLVEYYIRPPITIIIDFLEFKLDLWYIDMGLQLRSHKSNGIEIFINNYEERDILIGKYYRISDSTLKIINTSFRPSSLFSQNIQSFRSLSNVSAHNIHARNWKHCHNIKRIKIKITSTLNSTVPCLGFLNIYGKPSNLSQENLNNFLSIAGISATTNEEAKPEKKTPDSPSNLETIAPLEFFDSLTCEMMSMPYLLPSGKNVDKVTLDRYLDEKPMYDSVDPFTKVPFTDSKKPIFNVDLKARIDLFISTDGLSEIQRRAELMNICLLVFIRVILRIFKNSAMATAMWAVTQDVSSAALANLKESNHAGQNLPNRGQQGYHVSSFDRLPDKIILKIFSYLPHREIGRIARVCRKWRMIACDSRLWTHVSLRPEVSGLHVTSLETLLALISMRFGPSLRYIELPIELITHTVLHELANKCVNLTSMLLDFSTAMQLHDFNDLHSFPTKLRTMCICLSEVIFMEGFMRKIYNFINGLEVLHLIGTYEKAVDDEEEEIYEVVNIHKLKSAIPNLRVVNLFGINFVDDSHVESLSSNCIQLECLALNFCVKFTGSVLKVLFGRCKRLKCLLMQHTNLQSEHMMSVEWEKTSLTELDITATELSSECLINVLCRMPNLRYLSAGQQDSFTDVVLKEFMESGNSKSLISFDLDRNENLSEEMLMIFMKNHAPNLRGLQLSGIPHLTEQFWGSVIPMLKNIRILVIGMPEGCCQKIHQKIHIDSLIDSISNNCPNIERLEIRWDPETLRFSDRSNKAVDLIRLKCLRLRCWCLSDGKYFEMVKSNFERADRATVVRSTTNCRVTLVYLLNNYKDLIFN